MPEDTTEVQGATIVAETRLAKEMKAKTDAAFKAVQQAPPGIDSKEFSEELQAAINKDLGKTEPEPPPKAKSEPIKELPKEDAKTTPAEDIIPAELFGQATKKVDQAKAPDQTEADRQKFIEEQTKGMSQNAAAKFKAIEQRAHEASQKAKEFERRAQELEASNKKAIDELQAKLQAAANPKELDDLRQRVNELDQQLERRALLDHPKFKAAFDNRIDALVEYAKQYAPKEKASEIAVLLRQKDTPERNDKIDDIAEAIESSISRGKFIDAIKDLDKISLDREEKVAQWKENKRLLDEQEAKDRAQQAERNGHIQRKTAEQLNALWNETTQRLTSKEAEIEWYQKIEGNEKWNKEVDDRLRDVRALAEGEMPPDKLYELSALALSAPMFRRMFLEERAKTMKLNGEIASLKGAQPNPGAGGGGTGDDTGVTAEDDYITAAERQLVKQGHLR